jgi:hypothetical protein
MNTVPRVAITIIVGLSVYYFVFWVPFSLIPLNEQYWIASVGSLVCAIVAGRFVWSRTGAAESGVGAAVVRGALIVGGIGFVGGFFGPMIFAPGANQGPLLGLFITGPLGFLLGGVGGFVYGVTRAKSAPPR